MLKNISDFVLFYNWFLYILVLFNQSEIAARILQSNWPAEQKKLGRLIPNFNDQRWSDNCFDIVYKANIEKVRHVMAHQIIEIYFLFITSPFGNKRIITQSPF